MTKRKPTYRTIDPYGLEAMIDAFGDEAIRSGVEPLDQAKNRALEKGRGVDEVIRRLDLMFGSDEDHEKFDKLVRRFYGRHKALPLVFRDEKGVWSLWHEGQCIAFWLDATLPQLGPFIVSELLAPLETLLSLIVKEAGRKSGHGREMLRQRLANDGRQQTKSDDIYAAYLKGAKDPTQLAARFHTSIGYVRQSIRDHQDGARRKYKPKT